MENNSKNISKKSIGLGVASLTLGIISILIALQFLGLYLTNASILDPLFFKDGHWLENLFMLEFLAIILFFELIIFFITSIVGMSLGFGGIYQRQGDLANTGTILSVLSIFIVVFIIYALTFVQLI